MLWQMAQKMRPITWQMANGMADGASDETTLTDNKDMSVISSKVFVGASDV